MKQTSRVGPQYYTHTCSSAQIKEDWLDDNDLNLIYLPNDKLAKLLIEITENDTTNQLQQFLHELVPRELEATKIASCMTTTRAFSSRKGLRHHPIKADVTLLRARQTKSLIVSTANLGASTLIDVSQLNI